MSTNTKYIVVRADFYMGQMGYFYEHIEAPNEAIACENAVRMFLNGPDNKTNEKPTSVDCLVIESNKTGRHEVDVHRLTVNVTWIANVKAVAP